MTSKFSVSVKLITFKGSLRKTMACLHDDLQNKKQKEHPQRKFTKRTENVQPKL